jgi:hypothetical protein
MGFKKGHKINVKKKVEEPMSKTSIGELTEIDSESTLTPTVNVVEVPECVTVPNVTVKDSVPVQYDFAEYTLNGFNFELGNPFKDSVSKEQKKLWDTYIANGWTPMSFQYIPLPVGRLIVMYKK